jgi:hypothetical protein
LEIQRVRQTPQFDPYLKEQDSESGPDLKDIIRESKNFIEKRKAIKDKLEDDFENAQKFANNTFEIFRAVNIFKQQWKFEEFKQKEHETSEIRDLLEQLKTWKKGITNIGSNTLYGIVNVDGKNLARQLKDNAVNAFDEVKGYLVELVKKKADEILKDFEKVNNFKLYLISFR